jgi:hypothetical protein
MGNGEGGGGTVPARRDITILDLLTHRSGLSYGFLNDGPVGAAYRKNGVQDGLTLTTDTLENAIDKLAAQPLMSQPGAAWNYSLSTVRSAGCRVMGVPSTGRQGVHIAYPLQEGGSACALETACKQPILRVIELLR